jgi:hypothetical protein
LRNLREEGCCAKKEEAGRIVVRPALENCFVYASDLPENRYALFGPMRWRF